MRGVLLDPVTGRPEGGPRDLPLSVRENLARAGLHRFLGLPQPEMADAHANFAYSTVATAPSPATSGTSLVVGSGDGAKFPATPFNATVWPANAQPTTANAEIVRVTNRSSDTLTITRTQEGSSARSIGIGDQIAATITVKTLTDVESAHGLTSLIYRYTVTGSDKASIDTGVDTPDAGSNDWTNGDLLEIWIYTRTDQAVQVGDTLVTFNNDSGSTQYAHQRLRVSSGSATAADGTGAANIDLFTPGSSFLANVFGNARITIPNYAGTVGFKTYEVTEGLGTTSAGNGNWLAFGGTYRSTSAITRLAIANVSTQKFKVGSQLLIYKRLA